MSGEQAAVAEAAQIIATHTMCWQSDGDFGERQWIECNDIKCAWNDRDALDDVEAEYASFYAHVADTLVASGLLATATPARLSDEERADIWDEAAEATAEWMASNPGPSGIGSDPPRNPYEDAARAVQPTPPAQAEAVAAVCDRCQDESKGLGSSARCICGPNVPCGWCGQGGVTAYKLGVADGRRNAQVKADEAVAAVIECGHPNHGGVDHDCTPFKPETDGIGMRLIRAERQRQINVEGYTTEHDAEHGDLTIVHAANHYRSADPEAWKQGPPRFWPWGPSAWKPRDPISNLVRAGALYLAASDLGNPYGERNARECAAIIDAADQVIRSARTVRAALSPTAADQTAEDLDSHDDPPRRPLGPPHDG